MSERRRTLFRRANTGLVFQFFNLIPTLTVLELRRGVLVERNAAQESEGPK